MLVYLNTGIRVIDSKYHPRATTEPATRKVLHTPLVKDSLLREKNHLLVQMPAGTSEVATEVPLSAV